MLAQKLLNEIMEDLQASELLTIDGGNSLVNLIQHVISTPAGASMGNCVTVASNFWTPPAPSTPSTGFGCTRH